MREREGREGLKRKATREGFKREVTNSRMKVKQGKKTRKSMAMYTHVFGFRAPYRVLCDGNFLQV